MFKIDLDFVTLIINEKNIRFAIWSERTKKI